jgi:hypothetical protein
MPIETKSPEATLAELAKDHAKLAGKSDRASKFRCRMLAGRARSLCRKMHKRPAEQDAAFENWQKQAKPQRIGAGFFPIVD